MTRSATILQSLGHIRHFARLEVKLGDFLYLHTKHFQTFGIVIREPSLLQTDPFNDVFEIIDLKGNLVWGRLPNVKFYYPSILKDSQSEGGRKLLEPNHPDKEAFVKTAHTKLKATIANLQSFILPNSTTKIIEDWAHSIGDQSTFNLWDAYQVLLKCGQGRETEFHSLFSLFRFLYEKSSNVVRDSAFRINGPFSYRKQAQIELLHQCYSHFSNPGNTNEKIAKLRSKLTNSHTCGRSVVENDLERDLIEGMKSFAYCTFENSQNNPFKFVGEKLMNYNQPKNPYEMHDLLEHKGFIPIGFNPRIVESNLELNHAPSDCSVSFPNSKNTLLYEYKFNSSIRQKYSSSPVFTIDSVRASEIDDGISVDLPVELPGNLKGKSNKQRNVNNELDTLWFHVHIADCSAFFNLNDQIDLIGRRMVNSVYLPEQTFPMIPWRLTKTMSLEPEKKENHCLTFSFKINQESGDLKETKITPTLVGGSDICKITYSSVNLANNIYLKTIYNACKLHQKFRQDQKHLNVELPQPHIWVDQKTHEREEENFKSNISNFSINQSHGIIRYYDGLRFEYLPTVGQSQSEQTGHFIVSEMMIIAGRIASEFCRERGIPIPYRFQHLNPNWTENQIGNWMGSQTTTLPDAYFYARTAYPAEYGVTPLRHSSMGLNCYAKVTSPIRRYVDQLTHQQIKNWIMNEHSSQSTRGILTVDQLTPILSYINERELRTKWLQRNSARFWVVKLMKHLQENEMKDKNFILTGTIVYYNDMLNLFYIFLDYWNIPIIHREDTIQLDIGMKVDMRILLNEPMKSIFKVEIIRRHF